MADTSTTSYDVFKAELQTAFGMFDTSDDSWIKEIYNAGQNQLSEGVSSASIPDLLINDTSLTQYRSRFSGLIKLQNLSKTQSIAYVPDVAHYVAAERAMTDVFNRYGLTDMANKNAIADIIGNDVSVDEAASRVIDGYMAIKNADTALMAELKRQFPTLSDSDFVHSLLTSKDKSAEYLKNKVATAGIASEATRVGLQSQLTPEEIQKRGFSRAAAAQGFSAIADQQQGIQQAQKMFGDNTSQSDLQLQMEEEAFGGPKSKTAKKLASQARAQFGGSSGFHTGSEGLTSSIAGQL